MAVIYSNPLMVPPSLYRGDRGDASTYTGVEWLIYKYQVGYGKGWELLFSLFASDEDYALKKAQMFYKLPEGELLAATKHEINPGDWKVAKNVERP